MISKLESIIRSFNSKKGTLIPLLQAIQKEEGYISRDAIIKVTEITKISKAEIYGVATFYSMFRLKPQGKHTIRICKGTACHVSGVKTIIETLRDTLDLKKGEETTEDGLFTIIEVACLGCCSLAPVIMIDDKTYGKLTSEKLPKTAPPCKGTMH